MESKSSRVQESPKTGLCTFTPIPLSNSCPSSRHEEIETRRHETRSENTRLRHTLYYPALYCAILLDQSGEDFRVSKETRAYYTMRYHVSLGRARGDLRKTSGYQATPYTILCNTVPHCTRSGQTVSEEARGYQRVLHHTIPHYSYTMSDQTGPEETNRRPTGDPQRSYRGELEGVDQWRRVDLNQTTSIESKSCCYVIEQRSRSVRQLVLRPESETLSTVKEFVCPLN